MIKIYCDLDGVLADFNGSLAKTMNNYYKVVKYSEKQCIDLPFKKLILDAKSSINNNKFQPINFLEFFATREICKFTSWYLSKNECFWVNLPVLSNAKKLIKFISYFDYYFLTVPFDESSKTGKIKWLKDKFNLSFQNNYRIIFEKEKWKYADKDSILIDDTVKNVNLFKEHGGMAIYHKNVKLTLSKLKELNI